MLATASTKTMWGNRVKLTRRQAQLPFWDAFEELVQLIHSGQKYDPEETRYWEYIKSYHKLWQETPLTPRAHRQMTNKFRSAAHLYTSIKAEGMHDPLDLRHKNTKLFIYAGMRRLTIAHILGIPTLHYTVTEVE
jgi:hypothetical protein